MLENCLLEKGLVYAVGVFGLDYMMKIYGCLDGCPGNGLNETVEFRLPPGD